MTYIFLAEGFEEIEALTPLDLLRRAGVDVKTVGIGGKRVVGSHGIAVEADIDENEVSGPIDMIILPGGMPGTKNLMASETVMTAIHHAVQENAFIAAICAAPMILGKLGMLKGAEAVCYPGFEEYLPESKILNVPAVRAGKIIMGAGMGAAVDFGLLLVAALCGETVAEELRHSIIADR